MCLEIWGKHGVASRTYIPANGKGGTQIDFVLLRQNHLQASSKQIAQAELPFANTQGMRHVPLTGVLPRPVVPRGAKKQQQKTPTVSQMQKALINDPHIRYGA